MYATLKQVSREGAKTCVSMTMSCAWRRGENTQQLQPTRDPNIHFTLPHQNRTLGMRLLGSGRARYAAFIIAHSSGAHKFEITPPVLMQSNNLLLLLIGVTHECIWTNGLILALTGSGCAASRSSCSRRPVPCSRTPECPPPASGLGEEASAPRAPPPPPPRPRVRPPTWRKRGTAGGLPARLLEADGGQFLFFREGGRRYRWLGVEGLLS